MFPYFGKIDALHQTLKANRRKLEEVYHDVFGPELFEKVRHVDAECLDSRSFLSPEDLAKLGINPRSISNKYFLGVTTDNDDALSIQADGSFTPKRVYIAPGFIFTNEGFTRRVEQDVIPWISPYLGSYVHEYDHFAITATQEIPVWLASSLALSNLKAKTLPPLYQDLPGLVDAFEGTREEKMALAQLGTFAVATFKYFETATRLLDAFILSKLGYEVPLDYYDTPPRTVISVSFHNLGVMTFAPHGDLMSGLRMRERLEAMSQWHTYEGLNPVQQNFHRSLQECEIVWTTKRQIERMERMHQAD